MSLRALSRRTLRPHLSTRYQHLQLRHQTTSPPITEPSISPPPTPPPSSPRPPKPSRSYRSYLIASTIALALGYALGSYASHLIAPPPLPAAGSREDHILLGDLNKRLDEEFKVKVLRGKCLGVTRQLRGQEGGWVEVVAPADDSPAPGPGNGGTLMRALRAAKDLGVERVFWDRGARALVAIVHFGPDLAGWPGVTHGGLLATAVTEKIALADALTRPAAARSVSGAAVPQRLPGTGDHAKMPLPAVPPHEPAQLSIDYVKPTYANSFHVIRVSPAYGADESVRLPIQGHEWEATLETMEGRVCVKANAKFAPRSQAERVGEEMEEGAKWSYHEFREWLWPSRQKQSQIA